jgi:hypothetical protein
MIELVRCPVAYFRGKGGRGSCYEEIEQWFLTGVPRNTGVPWTSYKCSAKILKSVKKKFLSKIESF